ncbi:MAG TPA: hypothetical protein VNH11_18705 [Pirellulales bacterium]|nr:hypothetical protein [Pirellulales bacterium]
MLAPNVGNVVIDRERDIHYTVVAYRALTETELMFVVRQFLSSRKRSPKKGSRFEIVTSIGARD